MEENPSSLAPPGGRRRPASSRADRPCRLKPQKPRLDPAHPARFTGWRDDGDGMDQARALSALTAPWKKGREMHAESSGNNDDKSMPSIPESGILAYNVREGERPDGLKVRFKITIATGAEARELDARQAEAIRRLLQWAQQNQHPHSPGQD
jgi:hypothetical protein